MRSLDKDRWAVVSPLLDELFEADARRCALRLAEIRRDDAGLADLLEELLAEREQLERESFLEGQAVDIAQMELPEVPSLAGTTLGAYTLDRPLGQGGMGTVWLARRSDGRFEGQAAIKFLNLALLARGGAERFRREGNLLARLAHPNIARLLDAGVTPAGAPYLVLEYVDGEPIDRWCESRALGTAERLRLFVDVLAAVAHAHSNLILHRDLKPTNILVTQAGQVKLLDFGIGKLLADQQPTVPSELTQLSGRAFTVEYASPEQVLGDEVTTAADVYSLGVVLFELLAGVRPYKPRRASAAAVEEAVAEQDVPLASTVALRPDARRRLRGDLDAILNHALRKNPAERYATVGELAADIERHLTGLPVRAQPDRFGYRVAKFLRRNALATGAAAAVLVAVLAGSGVALWQAHEARLQRDRALALAARNASVVDFVGTMLMEAAPADEPVRVADLLDRSVSMLMAGGSNPDHEAAVLGMLSNYFASVPGNPARANELLVRSLALTKDTHDLGLRGALLCDSAYITHWLGKPAEALKLADEGIRLVADDDMAAFKCFQQRAGMARASGDPENTLKYARLARERLLGSGIRRPAEEASVLDTIAAAHSASGRFVAADRYFAMAIDKLAEAGRAESPRAGVIRNNWGVSNYAGGMYRRALDNYDHAVRVAVKWTPGGQAPAYMLSNRAKVLRDLGQYAEALAGFDAALAAARRSNEVGMQIDSLVHRAATHLSMADLPGAERAMADALAVRTKLNPASPTALSIKWVQARIDAAHGRHAEAIAGLTEVIAAHDKRKSLTGALTVMLRARSDVHLQAGQLAAAEADAARALEVSRYLQGATPQSILTGLSLLQVARVQQARGTTEDARRTAADAATHLTPMLGEQHPETLRARQIAA
jgi:serine/threonine-protein kinase